MRSSPQQEKKENKTPETVEKKPICKPRFDNIAKMIKEYIDGQKTHNPYLLLLELEKSDTSIREKLALLVNTTSNQGNNFGMVIAKNQDNNAAQQYLCFLKKAVDEFGDEGSKYIYGLLTAKNKNDYTLHLELAHCCDDTTNTQYFELLAYLAQKNISTQRLFNLVIKTGTLGDTYGMLMTDQEKSMLTLIAWLHYFMDNGISQQEIIRHLTTQNQWQMAALGHTVPSRHSTDVNLAFLSFLERLALQPNNVNDLLRLLELKTDSKAQSKQMGHYIALEQDVSVMTKYMALVSSLDTSIHRINALLNTTDTLGHTLYDKMVLHYSLKNLFAAINQQLFFWMENKKLLGTKKEAILDYILGLPFAERKQALQNALNDSHPLHAFFAIQRGSRKPRLGEGTFAKIQAALEALSNIITPVIDMNKVNQIIYSSVNTDGTPVLLNYYEPTTIQNAPLLFTMPAEQTTGYMAASSSSGIYPTYMSESHFTNPTASILNQPIAPSPILRPIYSADEMLLIPPSPSIQVAPPSYQQAVIETTKRQQDALTQPATSSAIGLYGSSHQEVKRTPVQAAKDAVEVENIKTPTKRVAAYAT